MIFTKLWACKELVLMNNQIKKEYFELVNKLNQSNKIKNEDTNLYFYIEIDNSNVEKLFAAISEGQKILLLERRHKRPWTVKYMSGSPSLEDFLVEILNLNSHSIDLTSYIKSHIFELK